MITTAGLGSFVPTSLELLHLRTDPQRCPRCAGPALIVLPLAQTTQGALVAAPLRLVCAWCEATVDRDPAVI